MLSLYRVSLGWKLMSFNGYKDWFIDEFKKPGYILELGKKENTISLEQIQKIYNDIEERCLTAIDVE